MITSFNMLWSSKVECLHFFHAIQIGLGTYRNMSISYPVCNKFTDEYGPGREIVHCPR